MSTAWAVRLPRSSVPAALPLRLRPAVEAHDAGDAIWLRGPRSRDDSLLAALRRIPAVARFTVDANHILTPFGRRLPAGSLPAGPWEPFATFARLRLPPAALPAEIVGRVPFRVVPADHEADVAALLVPLDRWAAYAATAPKVRLDRLRFAVRRDGTALVVGRPLPPIPGLGLVGDAGLLLPAGLAWHPPVDAATVRLALALSDGDLALFDPDGTHERLPAEAFVAATRAAARASAGQASLTPHPHGGTEIPVGHG